MPPSAETEPGRPAQAPCPFHPRRRLHDILIEAKRFSLKAPLSALMSQLLKFDERSEKILGVQEEIRLAMCTNPGFAIAENPGTGRKQSVAGIHDIRHLVTDMMHAARRVL